MKILLYPFYSQQDKSTGKFQLKKCCVTNINVFLANKFLSEGNEVQIILPKEFEDVQQRIGHVPPYPSEAVLTFFNIPNENLMQRLYQNPNEWEGNFEYTDLIISHHELQSVFLKQMFDGTPIIQFNHMMPVGDWEWMKGLQAASWEAADGIVVLSSTLARKLRRECVDITKVGVWPMCYSELEAVESDGLFATTKRDIDILFVQRASASNYTHHFEFLEAIRMLNRVGYTGKVGFTDSTGYLRNSRLPLPDNVKIYDAPTRTEYWELLHRSKAAIAMMKDDLHGGIAIREAMRAGCIPLVLKTEAYEDLLMGLPEDWKNIMFIRSLDHGEIAKTIMHTLILNRDEVREGVIELITKQSFEKAWDVAKKDLIKNGWYK